MEEHDTQEIDIDGYGSDDDFTREQFLLSLEAYVGKLFEAYKIENKKNKHKAPCPNAPKKAPKKVSCGDHFQESPTKQQHKNGKVSKK